MESNPFQYRDTARPGQVVAKRPGLTVLELFVVIAIIAVLLALFLPATRRSRGALRRSRCHNNVRNIMLALHNYHDDHGAFPPAFTVDENGNRLHSWRTLILPYLEQPDLFTRIDLSKPWSHPVNTAAMREMPAVFRCESVKLPDGHTTYLGLVGPRAFFSDDGRPRQLDDITDSHDHTVAIAEVPSVNAMHWMNPHDDGLTVFLHRAKDLPTAHIAGAHVGLVSGGARYFSDSIEDESREGYTTIDGGEVLPEE